MNTLLHDLTAWLHAFLIGFTVVLLIASPWVLKMSFHKTVDAQTWVPRLTWFILAIVAVVCFMTQSGIVAHFIIKH